MKAYFIPSYELARLHVLQSTRNQRSPKANAIIQRLARWCLALIGWS